MVAHHPERPVHLLVDSELDSGLSTVQFVYPELTTPALSMQYKLYLGESAMLYLYTLLPATPTRLTFDPELVDHTEAQLLAKYIGVTTVEYLLGLSKAEPAVVPAQLSYANRRSLAKLQQQSSSTPLLLRSTCTAMLAAQDVLDNPLR